jgi:hypothetical protein
MESLGAYLFAGAFRFLGHRSCPLRPARKRRRPNVLMENAANGRQLMLCCQQGGD